MVGLFFLLVVLIALAVIATKTLVATGEDERLVVIRLGQVLEVRDSGMNIILPFVDRAIKVNVERIPGWTRLSANDLNKKIVDLALSEVAIPPGKKPPK